MSKYEVTVTHTVTTTGTVTVEATADTDDDAIYALAKKAVEEDRAKPIAEQVISWELDDEDTECDDITEVE